MMSVFIYQDDALEKLCIVEGAEFEKWCNDPSDCSFGSNLLHWKDVVAKFPGLLKSDLAYDFSWGRPGTLDGIIYGLWGYHRYLVRNSGEILFHRYFCTWEKHIELARKTGFRIFPDDAEGPV